MKRVIVIGCPGSGKSTFSRALRDKTGLALYHLDMLYWNEDRTTVERSAFLERLSAVLSEDEWIIDGNYASTMEMRMAACDTAGYYTLDITGMSQDAVATALTEKLNATKDNTVVPLYTDGVGTILEWEDDRS